MIKMSDEKKWKTLMKINDKVQYAINSLKSINIRDCSVTFSADELYLIAELSGSEATILKRQMALKGH